MVKRGMVGSEGWKNGIRLKKYQRQQGTDFSHTITRKRVEDFAGAGFKFQEGAESYEQWFWLEASTKIINNQQSLLTGV